VMMSTLDHPRGHRAIELDQKGLRSVVKAATGSRKGAASPRSSTPRSARK
jgi:hypothetical protein